MRKPPPRAAHWKPRLVVACGQMEVTADIGRNLATILAQIAEARRHHRARMILFPETALSGYAPAHHPDGTAGIDFAELARATAAVRAAARAHRIAVVVGTTTRTPRGRCNTTLAISKQGRVAARYDKLHLTEADRAWYAAGAARLRPTRLAGTSIGMQICFDMRFPEPWRILALSGVRLFLHATFAAGRDQLWKREAIEANLSSRCSENSCWMASANAAGPFQWLTSRLIDPDGLVIAQAQLDAEQVISAAIDPEWLGRSGGFLASRRGDLRGK